MAFFISIQQFGSSSTPQLGGLVEKGSVHNRMLLWHIVVWLIFAEVAEWSGRGAVSMVNCFVEGAERLDISLQCTDNYHQALTQAP